jgi:hypothetical protein
MLEHETGLRPRATGEASLLEGVPCILQEIPSYLGKLIFKDHRLVQAEIRTRAVTEASMMSDPIAKETRKSNRVFDAKMSSHDSIGRLKDNPLSIVTLGASELSRQLKLLHGTVKNRNPTFGELLLDPGRVDAVSILRSTKLRKDVDLSTLDALGRDAPHAKLINAACGPTG